MRNISAKYILISFSINKVKENRTIKTEDRYKSEDDLGLYLIKKLLNGSTIIPPTPTESRKGFTAAAV